MKLISTAKELDSSAPGESMLMRASASTPEVSGDSRKISYIFSDDSVARDGHTIASNGWSLGPFLKNPVFLFAHDGNQPPVGRVTSIATVGGKLRGTVEYMEKDVYPFADTIFQMVKRGFLNAVSVSWLPLEWKYSTDKTRMNGIDFLKQELLEVSQVPVPALSTAIVEARAHGIDTGPFVEWAEKTLDGGSMVMVPRSQLEAMRRNAKMPAPSKPQTAALTSKSTVRGLYSVGTLASLISYLMSVQADVEWEADVEEDGSTIPDRLLAAAKELGQILVDMTVEEVTELFAGTEDDGGDVDFVEALEAAAKSPAQRMLIKLDVIGRKMQEAVEVPDPKSTLTLTIDTSAIRKALDDFKAELDELKKGRAALAPAQSQAEKAAEAVRLAEEAKRAAAVDDEAKAKATRIRRARARVLKK